MAITVQFLDGERTAAIKECGKAMSWYLQMIERSRLQLDLEEKVYQDALLSHMNGKHSCLKYLEREYATIHKNKINKLFNMLLREQWEAWEKHKVNPDIEAVVGNCEEILDIFSLNEEEGKLPWDVQD